MTQNLRPVYIIDGARTPFIKAAGKPGPFSAADLGVLCARELLAHQPFPLSSIQEVVTGCVIPSANEANIARIIALRLGLGDNVPAYTVQRNCASGLQALDSAYLDISTGRYDLVLAGGTEAMSRAPLIFNDKMTLWFAHWFGAKSWTDRLKTLLEFRPSYLNPVIALLCGLTDPLKQLSMGQTAEILAARYNISREDMDKFSLDSQKKAAKAQDEGHFKGELVPIIDNNGMVYDADTGIRRDTNLEKLAKLKPYFDKKFGNVTAGNSAQVTDGAAFLILGSEDAVQKYHLPVLGKIIDFSWAALDPTVMGLGPAYAIPPLLARNHLKMSDISEWEINEAFAAQMIACLKAMDDPKFCETNFGSTAGCGQIPLDHLNVDGGGIALGHPVGASGARITLHLLNTLKRNHGKYGVASLCIGGGQGGAILVENIILGIMG